MKGNAQMLPRTTSRQVEQEHQDTIDRISKMNPIYKDICPGIPTFNKNHKLHKAKKALKKAQRAEQILKEAFNGTISYSGAYRDWTLYNGHCNHGIQVFSAEQDNCHWCDMTAYRLNNEYKENWND